MFCMGCQLHISSSPKPHPSLINLRSFAFAAAASLDETIECATGFLIDPQFELETRAYQFSSGPRQWHILLGKNNNEYYQFTIFIHYDFLFILIDDLMAKNSRVSTVVTTAIAIIITKSTMAMQLISVFNNWGSSKPDIKTINQQMNNFCAKYVVLLGHCGKFIIIVKCTLCKLC